MRSTRPSSSATFCSAMIIAEVPSSTPISASITLLPIFGASRATAHRRETATHPPSGRCRSTPCAVRRPTDDRPDVHQLSQRRKYLEDPLLALRALTPGARGKGAGIQMLLHGQAMEDLVALRDERQPGAHDLMGVSPRALAACTTDLVAVQLDRAALPAGEPGDCVEQGRLAVTVETDDADALAGLRRRNRGRGSPASDRIRPIAPTFNTSRLEVAGGPAAGGFGCMNSCFASRRTVFEIGRVDLRIGEHIFHESFGDDLSGIHDHHAIGDRPE